jgi:hypothetical protein
MGCATSLKAMRAREIRAQAELDDKSGDLTGDTACAFFFASPTLPWC